uniref:Uncharacterized protein n=1 Tax=Morchella brunnea TaxID=1174671 RepID=A0A8K1I7X4_9PEZI|nr:hypothetical protein LK370_mgp002 [Morchella brunnea]UBU98474.1 hypothetical protein [Morchella brunnea]
MTNWNVLKWIEMKVPEFPPCGEATSQCTSPQNYWKGVIKRQIPKRRCCPLNMETGTCPVWKTSIGLHRNNPDKFGYLAQYLITRSVTFRVSIINLFIFKLKKK